MTCAILSIGTEITRGELVNTNAAWLAASLTDLGFAVLEQATVDDDVTRIVATLERLAKSARVIISTGGLGPTTDDLTTAAVANALGVPLERDAASLDHIRRRFERLGRTMSPSNEKQADFPKGAGVLSNPLGTAPGFDVTFATGARAFFMPGVPREMQKMFEEQVTPRIRDLSPNDSHQIRLRTFGMPESVVGEKLAGIEASFASASGGLTIGYRAHFPEIEVKVLARGKDKLEAHDIATRAAVEVRARLADVLYGEGEDTFPGIVGRALRTRGWTLAVAESCTGGLVGHLLTREAGASDYFLLDAVTYANSAKQTVLGVDEDALRGHGAVSAEVASCMAEGARRVSGADVALAITGIAGPTGGTETKPVGLVYLAVATSRGTVVKERQFQYSDRTMIQTIAAYAGLALVLEAAR